MHAVARALAGQKPFVDTAKAWWLMGRLRLAFPATLAACVMPNHVHLVTTGSDRRSVRVKLARVLGGLTAKAELKRLFEPVPEPDVVVNGKELERLVRYVHLNPCRAQLATDPLSWPWSTHRGLLGAEVDPWVTADHLARVLGRPARGFPAWLHAYVTGDPSVHVSGTAPPVPCKPSDLPAVPVEVIRRAALGATPWSAPGLRRKMIVELALHQGWRDTDLLGRATGLTSRSVRRLMAEPRDPEGARASQTCLGDRRLLLPEALIRPLGPRPR